MSGNKGISSVQSSPINKRLQEHYSLLNQRIQMKRDELNISFERAMRKNDNSYMKILNDDSNPIVKHYSSFSSTSSYRKYYITPMQSRRNNSSIDLDANQNNNIDFTINSNSNIHSDSKTEIKDISNTKSDTNINIDDNDNLEYLNSKNKNINFRCETQLSKNDHKIYNYEKIKGKKGNNSFDQNQNKSEIQKFNHDIHIKKERENKLLGSQNNIKEKVDHKQGRKSENNKIFKNNSNTLIHNNKKEEEVNDVYKSMGKETIINDLNNKKNEEKEKINDFVFNENKNVKKMIIDDFKEERKEIEEEDKIIKSKSNDKNEEKTKISSNSIIKLDQKERKIKDVGLHDCNFTKPKKTNEVTNDDFSIEDKKEDIFNDHSNSNSTLSKSFNNSIKKLGKYELESNSNKNSDNLNHDKFEEENKTIDNDCDIGKEVDETRTDLIANKKEENEMANKETIVIKNNENEINNKETDLIKNDESETIDDQIDLIISKEEKEIINKEIWLIKNDESETIDDENITINDEISSIANEEEIIDDDFIDTRTESSNIKFNEKESEVVSNDLCIEKCNENKETNPVTNDYFHEVNSKTDDNFISTVENCNLADVKYRIERCITIDKSKENEEEDSIIYNHDTTKEENQIESQIENQINYSEVKNVTFSIKEKELNNQINFVERNEEEEEEDKEEMINNNFNSEDEKENESNNELIENSKEKVKKTIFDDFDKDEFLNESINSNKNKEKININSFTTDDTKEKIIISNFKEKESQKNKSLNIINDDDEFNFENEILVDHFISDQNENFDDDENDDQEKIKKEEKKLIFMPIEMQNGKFKEKMLILMPMKIKKKDNEICLVPKKSKKQKMVLIPVKMNKKEMIVFLPAKMKKKISILMAKKMKNDVLTLVHMKLKIKEKKNQIVLKRKKGKKEKMKISLPKKIKMIKKW